MPPTIIGTASKLPRTQVHGSRKWSAAWRRRRRCSDKQRWVKNGVREAWPQFNVNVDIKEVCVLALLGRKKTWDFVPDFTIKVCSSRISHYALILPVAREAKISPLGSRLHLYYTEHDWTKEMKNILHIRYATKTTTIGCQQSTKRREEKFRDTVTENGRWQGENCGIAGS